MEAGPRATWALPERLNVAQNESVARFIERARPSAHSDVATELELAAEGLPGVGQYCPDPHRYAYVALHDGAGRIFALAYGMRGLALRVGAGAMEEAIAEGAEAEPGIGDGWAVFDPFSADERTEATRARLRRWAARAFRGDGEDRPIYHLAPLSEFRVAVKRGFYTPSRFAQDGFVHCADRESVLAVAADYFVDATEPVLLVEIDPSRLGARVVREAPAPIPGGGVSHLAGAARFPHVYGPIELAAITGVAPLVKRGGQFTWPERFSGVREALGRGAVR